jgi:hypothetical protein
MRTTLPCFLFLISLGARAQCDFNPTIIPAQVILCPDENAVLSTQEYDTYQWYKDGVLIDGATDQVLEVPDVDAVGASYTVEATLDGCTELSPPRLVDGWAFLPPTVMTSGAAGWWDKWVNFYFCEGETVYLILNQPYDIDIQWTDNGVPIPGATNDTLVITDDGNYSVSGAPSICPNYNVPFGLTLTYDFVPPIEPAIALVDDELCATPEGMDGYQWYLDGDEIDGATTACITPTGAGLYTVMVDPGHYCHVPSQPYLIVGMDELGGRNTFQVSPLPARDQVTITHATGMLPRGTWALSDMTGRAVRRGAFSGMGAVSIDVLGLPSGQYVFRAQDDAHWAPMPLTVAH